MNALLEEEDDSAGTKEAGVIRALTKATAVAYRTIVFGSLPRRVPIKHVGVVTDRVTTMLDTYIQLRDAKTQVEVHHSTPRGPALRNLPSYLLSKIRLVGHTVATALPPLVQSMVLGTAVFSIYEEVKDVVDTVHGITDQGPPPEQQPSVEGVTSPDALSAAVLLSKTLSSSLIAGGLAGASHGMLFTAWEHMAGAIKAKGPVPTLLPGTMAAHATSHSTLFGSYEASKHVLFLLTGSDHSKVEGVACVAAAGAVAGICEESVSYYTVRWEEEGVQSLRKAWARLGPPPAHVLRSAVLPGALGFLAFEYGRDVVVRKDEGYVDDDDDDDRPPLCSE